MCFGFFSLCVSIAMSALVGLAIQDGQYWAAGAFVPMAALPFVVTVRLIPTLKGTPDDR